MPDNALPGAGSLRRRASTAFWLGSLVVAAVLLLPTSGFALFLGLGVLVGAWEWCGLAGIGGLATRLLYLALMAATLFGLWFWPDVWPPLLMASLAWWLVQSAAIPRVRRIELVERPTPGLLIAGLLVLATTWAALLSLHRIDGLGPMLVLALLVLIATADSAAYFVGRRWGHVKLAPAVSPGKTRAGVQGGLAGAALVGAVLAWLLPVDLAGALLVLLVCVLAAMLSVVGDLYESLLKRRRNLKDSSQLLPGHGGLLDRIDSLTAAAPLYALGMTWALT